MYNLLLLLLLLIIINVYISIFGKHNAVSMWRDSCTLSTGTVRNSSDLRMPFRLLMGFVF